ncbi:nucleoside kinase [Saccharicrinis sp. FJH62]|uniref:nucleoside kinase n=1 Tax=Saccharicrinis sp. FJH62 TaxID=3344657 RepID=UPI0035D51EEB
MMKNSLVAVKCLNNSTRKNYPMGTTLIDIFRDLDVKLDNEPLCALVNNEAKELNFRVFKPKTVEFVDFTHLAGHRAFVRSVAFVLHKAVKELYPKSGLRIEHAVSNGYFCKINGEIQELTEEIIAKIKSRMQEIVNADIPFVRHEEETEKVLQLFEEQDLCDKVKLLKTLGWVYSPYYTLEDTVDYYYGTLVPSTGYIHNFSLVKYHDGALIRIPMRTNPDKLEPVVDMPKLTDIFGEYAKWNGVMKLQNVGDLNEAADNGKVRDLIKVAEAFHEKKVAHIADLIAERKDEVKIILVSGPSSSGKTTFSKRLSLQLMVAGINPVGLSLDNYFVDREKTPLDENGQLDFESLYALNLDLFNQQMRDLLDGKEVELPQFSFTEGKSYFRGDKMKMEADDVLIIEGIHGLNPELTRSIDDKFKFKIYVSALTTISLDNHNWIPTSDNRLIRRIIRDNRYRGYSATETISRWESVRSGEDKWIYPYQENANIMFNSALLFELAVLKRYAEPILREVRQDSPHYAEAIRLLDFLRYFKSIRDSEIPPTSLIREFLGGSSFRY